MRGLGELEGLVMEVLWQADGPLLVRDVLERLSARRVLAYTTVLTVLDNLHRKGWVSRELDGRAYRYRPTSTRAEATAAAVRALLAGSSDPDGALLHFVRSASERESDVLRKGLRDRPDPA